MPIKTAHSGMTRVAVCNQTKVCGSLIKNGKYYTEPPSDIHDAKELFRWATAAGIGRPVDVSGAPSGSWTTELLATAISQVEDNESGIELRTIQLWFQDNQKGISSDNIRRLSKVFGCADPVATSEWQVRLRAAQSRLVAERRKARRMAGVDELQSKPVEPPDHRTDVEEQVPDALVTAKSIEGEAGKAAANRTHGDEYRPRTLAERCECMLSGSASLNLMIWHWLIFCGLGLMNYTMNTLSVVYSPYEGLDKQVGFIWAPTLTVLPLVVTPLLIFYISDLTTYWKRVGRWRCLMADPASIEAKDAKAWRAKINEYSFSFRGIVLFNVLFVFGFQWAGIYLPIYLSGDIGGVQIDRYLIALVRPEIISVHMAMVLSFFGYMYTASYITVFMLGLLLLIIVVLDYQAINTSHHVGSDSTNLGVMRREGLNILWGGYRIVVLAIWMASLLKLQIMYLSSNAPDFLAWMRADLMDAFSALETRNGWLPNTSVSHFTTFMMVVVTATVFLVCLLKIQGVSSSLWGDDLGHEQVQGRSILLKMLATVALLSLDFTLIGHFSGFFMLVGVSAIASVHVLSGPKLGKGLSE